MFQDSIALLTITADAASLEPAKPVFERRELVDASNAAAWDDRAADMHRIYAATYLSWARGHLATLAALPPFPLPR